MSDWRNPEDYAYTKTLSLHQWAWEFLRRNPHYRESWLGCVAAGDLGIAEECIKWDILGMVDPQISAPQGVPLFSIASGVTLIYETPLRNQRAEAPTLRFNLRMMLAPQLNAASRILRAIQADLEERGQLTVLRPASRPQREKFSDYIRALDAAFAGASQKSIGTVLFSDAGEIRDSARYALKQGRALSGGGYRDLLLMDDE